MSDAPQGPGWWQASDGKWYSPEQAPGGQPAPQAGGGGVHQPQTPGGSAPNPTADPTPGNAFNYGWLKFQQNIGPIIIAALVGFGIFVVLLVIGYFLFFTGLAATAPRTSIDPATGRTVTEGGSGFFVTFFFGWGAMYLLYWMGILLFQMAIIRGALKITYGEPLTPKELFSTDNLPQYLLASLIVAIASTFGFFLCFIPGLIVIFFLQFYGYFILDKNMSAMDGLKASAQLVNRNLGTIIGFYIGTVIAYAVGLMLCGIGLILAVPVVVIATAFMYRRLQGEPVAA